MSYLDKPLTKESYFEHIRTKSASHRTNTRIALDWFEKFCLGQFDGKTMDVVLEDSLKQKYDEPQRHVKNMFSLLQDFINYLSLEGHDPSTIRLNLNLLRNYLNWYGFEIYSEFVKSRLNFPKKIQEEAYPLTLDDIKKILHESNPTRRSLYLFLTSTGMRIQETMSLRKRDLDFGYDRIMVRIPGKYTKTKKPRKTFVTKEAENALVSILKKKRDDDLIFGTHDDSLKSKHVEQDYFHRLRIRAGLTEKYDNGINKITLHSFRSWFITKCNRVDSDFGNALAGHEKYMKRYDRLTDSEKIELFIRVEPSLSIYDPLDTVEQSKKIEQLRNEIIQSQEENMALRTKLSRVQDSTYTKQEINDLLEKLQKVK